MSQLSAGAVKMSHEIMPRVYRAVLDASHRSERVTVVVGPGIWADMMLVGGQHRGLTASDLVRNKIDLPKVMGVSIIDDQGLEPRGIVVRGEVVV